MSEGPAFEIRWDDLTKEAQERYLSLYPEVIHHNYDVFPIATVVHEVEEGDGN